MKGLIRNGVLGAAILGAATLSGAGAFAASSTDVEVDPGTPGASVDVEEHHGILPRNRGTDVHVEGATPAPDAHVSDTPPPPDGGVVEEHSETTIEH